MKLKIAFSTCPNDTFMFDALVHHKTDTHGFDFDVDMADIEKLNMMAFQQSHDVLKVSFHAYAGLSENYQILNSGSAVGYENGPLLISKRKVYPDEINHLKIAIPGKMTTANLLLSIAYPGSANRIEYLFSNIEEAVLSGETDAGLIIHENRFTYKNKGLQKIVDLGEYWQKETNLPVPLGGIIIKRSLPENVKKEFNMILKRSIQYAIDLPSSAYQFVKKHAQETDDEVIYKHIQLYVNDYSLDLGEDGKKAILGLYKMAVEKEIIESLSDNIFV
ncbi:MAG: 1,4-dihydroxy-6-naphthoate synthase [Bacteroidota bacterium]